MENLTLFETIAGSASIISVLWLVVSSIKKGLKVYKEKKESAEKELEIKISSLKASGGSVSSRTDLGFLVLIELKSISESISFYQNHRTLFMVITVLIINMSFMEGFNKFPIYFSIFELGTLILATISHNNAVRMKRLFDSLESQILEVWKNPVSKRVENKKP